VEPVTAPEGDCFAADLAALMRPVLEQLGTTLTARAKGVTWNVEFPPSRVDGFVALLTFVSHRDPTVELVVLSMGLRRRPSVSWTVDVRDRESAPLYEASHLSDALQLEMASDPEVAARVLTELVRDQRDLIAHELAP
jgi:hypothetical protein